MDAEGFGGCSNHRECEASCPKNIGIDHIARLNRDYIKASLTHGRRAETAEGGVG